MIELAQDRSKVARLSFKQEKHRIQIPHSAHPGFKPKHHLAFE